jgi:hypothetical protein
MAPLFEFDASFLPTDLADELLAFADSQEFIEYPFRGKTLVRSPKVEFRLDDSVGTYRWGQERRSHDWGATAFPDVLLKVRDLIGDPCINHAIIIKYTDGKRHHIPFHSDKQEGTDTKGAKDIVGGSNIYNLVVCHQPRVFQLAYATDIEDGGGEPLVFVMNQPMEHGSMVMLTAEGNRLLKHRVPKEKGWKGVRYSIVMRQIKAKSDK